MTRALAKQEQEGLAVLIEQARLGSREAFDELIRRFEKQVTKTALYLTGNLDDAQDVAQEVYLKIFRHLSRYPELEKIERWVYRITVNAARDFQRRKRFWQPLEKVITWTAPRDPVPEREIRSRLMDSLSRLSLNERAVVILKELEEMETEEVAEILGTTAVTVRGHLHSARKKLQRYLSDLRDFL